MNDVSTNTTYNNALIFLKVINYYNNEIDR